MAPAWPVTPPPSTLIIALKRPSVPVTRNGILTSASSIAFPKCSASERPLTTISPSPGSSRPRRPAFARPPDDPLRSALEELAERLLLEALRVAAVPDVELALDLVTTDGDLRSIQDDHVVARVERLRVGGLVLPGEDAGDPGPQAAQWPG